MCPTNCEPVHFPHTLNAITRIMDALEIQVPDYLGGKEGLCHQMVQSGHGFYCDVALSIGPWWFWLDMAAKG